MAGYRDVIVASLETPIVGNDDVTEGEMIQRIFDLTSTDVANDIIAALESAGYCIVPHKPTDKMLHHGEGYMDLVLPDDVFVNSRANRIAELRVGYIAMLASRPKE